MEASPEQRRVALGWLLDPAGRNDVWIMAEAAKLSRAGLARPVSNDGDMIASRDCLRA